MVRPLMLPPIPPLSPDRTPMERTADLTRRLLAVPKSAIPTKPKKRKKKRGHG